MNAVLETDGLGKVHGEGAAAVTALADVDLRVAHGEFVAITGPSGCGKSTLLNLLGGLDRPTSGEVRVQGERAGRRQRGPPCAAAPQRGRLRVPVLQPDREPDRGRQRRAAGAAGRRPGEGGAPPRGGAARAARPGDTAPRVPGDLSGGQQQRVAIARALVNRPTVLLADEPTGNLDTAAAREVVAVLRERHAHGQTIVLVTHDMRVASAAQRVVAMRDGRIVGETPLPEAGEGVDALSRVVTLEA